MRTAESYPGTLCICIDGDGPDPISGRFYHRYGDQPVRFKNAFQMILRAEDIFEWAGVPMANLRERSFNSEVQGRHNRKALSMKKVDEMIKNNGEKATFIVHVQFRQNASWQGTVTWVDENKNSYFRSALELIKLIDSTTNNKELRLRERDEISADGVDNKIQA